MHRLIVPPSEVRKLPMNGFTVGPPEAGMRLRIVSPVSMPWATLAPAAHQAVLSSETSSSTASPVRSRWNSAAEMPPGDVHAADRIAERRNALRQRAVRAPPGVIACPMPLRDQKAVPSKPPMSRSGPLSP